MKTRKISIRTKLMILISGMCIICLALIGVVTYNRVSRMMVELSKESTMSIAVVAANEIDGTQFATIESVEDDYYQVVYDSLAKYKQGGMITYIYTMKMDDDILRFVVDTDEEEPAELGEEYELLDDMRPAFDGQACCDSEITSDEWGTYYSSYAPIFDEAGNVVGIVGCDITLDSVEEQLSGLRNLIIMLVIVSCVICVGLAVVVGNGIGNNLKSLYLKVQELNSGHGNLAVQLNIHSGDELESIAVEFNQFIQQIQSMVSEVAAVSQMVESNSVTVNDSVETCNQQLVSMTAALEALSANMQETSASTNVMTEGLLASAGDVTELYEQAQQASAHAREISEGAASEEQNVLAMKEQSRQIIEKLQAELITAVEGCKEIEKIDAITEEILKVANKTQMLALNANIEAARAGTFGRGFSVIAGDIRNLSQQISVLVNNIQNTNQSVQAAVNALVENVNVVSEFLNQSVMADYEKFAQLGNAYSSNMTRVSELLQAFSNTTDSVHNNIMAIRENVLEIDKMVEDATDNIMDINTRGNELSGTIGILTDTAEENADESKRLNGQVNQYSF